MGPLTWEFQSGQGKVRENGKSQGKWNQVCFFQALNTPKLVFWPGLCPETRWGSLQCSPRPLVGWGGGHPIPFPQRLQTQLLNNWLSGLTLVFINRKPRLLTISVNTRYQVIFACLYWKSHGKVGEFHVVWKVVTLQVMWQQSNICMFVKLASR